MSAVITVNYARRIDNNAQIDNFSAVNSISTCKRTGHKQTIFKQKSEYDILLAEESETQKFSQ